MAGIGVSLTGLPDKGYPVDIPQNLSARGQSGALTMARVPAGDTRGSRLIGLRGGSGGGR